MLIRIVLFLGNMPPSVHSMEPTCNPYYDILKTVLKLEQKIETMENVLQEQRNVISKMSKEGNGAVFVRWGRNICPDSSSLVYNGYTAGKHVHKKGSGSDTICLPSHPSWANYTGKSKLSSLIYGTEIDINEPSGIFAYPVNQQDMPCAVCVSKNPTVLMVPAKTACYSGWLMEYTGYLMAGMDNSFGSHNHICMDSLPEFLPNGAANNDQHILYLVKAQCGSLPCPPYVQDRELACVVCSK
ncbi:short-chain collagen C4-like [Ruditapes philippinarum]|uniref:short-chain collagen C4-like n=1 Tax=Ruditapes philippinarum TaxID=129788 RepID=UPI00295AE21D|nr:short-chain collagen C4-like [Ruditapes philippinarum]